MPPSLTLTRRDFLQTAGVAARVHAAERVAA
jgi:hypothetical protein